MRKIKRVYFGCFFAIFFISTINFGCCSYIDFQSSANFKEESIILLTGFENFSSYDINPSQLIVESLNGQIIDGFEIKGIVLPVDFDRSIENLTQAIEEYSPIFVISFGLDAGTNKIDVEKLSINLKKDPKNVNIFKFLPRLIDPGSPFFRPSTLKTKEMIEDLKDANIPTKLSFFAGTYVCNSVFYQTINYIDENNLDIISGFVHVPLLDSQSLDGMPLETMIDASTIIIKSNL